MTNGSRELLPQALDVPRCEIGASPIWEADAGRIIWVDVMAGRVHRLRPGSGPTGSASMPSAVGTIVPRRRGGYVLGLEDGFWLADDDLGDLRRVGAFHDAAEGIRMNAGKADASGRFWAGTMAYDLRPGAGALGRLDADGTITVHVTGLGEANGLGWSPDGATFYLVDSGIGVVDAFEFDASEGTLGHRQTLISVPKEDGLTDGMTVDADGYLWLTLWGGWQIRRYSPRGDLDQVITLPVAQVSGCTFGGDDLADLYITTAAYQLSDEGRRAQPLAGSLFTVRPGPTGLPAGRFEG